MVIRYTDWVLWRRTPQSGEPTARASWPAHIECGDNLLVQQFNASRNGEIQSKLIVLGVAAYSLNCERHAPRCAECGMNCIESLLWYRRSFVGQGRHSGLDHFT